MPWTVADVDSHIKGLGDKQKKAWVATANGALKNCIDNGGDDKTCAPRAIKIANVAAQKVSESRLDGLDDSAIEALALHEAATIKNRAIAAMRAADLLLADKDLPEEAIAPIKSMRATLKKRWVDIRTAKGLEATKPTTESTDPNDVAAMALVSSEDTDENIGNVLNEAADILRQDDSMDSLRVSVQNAIRQYLVQQVTAQAGGSLVPGDLYDCYCWIRDLFDGAAIFEWRSELYRADYTRDANGDITINAVSDVQVAYVPVDSGAGTDNLTESRGMPRHMTIMPVVGTIVAESGDEVTGDIVPLQEAHVKDDGTVRIKIISPGWGTTGYYSEETLKQAAEDNIFHEGLHMYFDHPSKDEADARPERSLRDLSGVITSRAAYTTEDGPGLYADAKVFSPYHGVLKEVAPYIGTSVRALGLGKIGTAEGKTGRIVDKFVKAASVDFVTQAGRGGKVLDLMESARNGKLDEYTNKISAEDTKTSTESTRKGQEEVDEKEVTALQESIAAERKAREEMAAKFKRTQEALAFREARDFASGILNGIKGLHERTRARLAESLMTSAPIAESETGDLVLDKEAFTTTIKEAAAAEMEYLKEAAGYDPSAVRGMGHSESGEGLKPEDAENALLEAAREMGLTDKEAKYFAAGR